MIPPANYVAYAQATARQFDRPASVALGQAQLESRFGRHMPPGSNNPLGIKEFRPGMGVVAGTTEGDGRAGLVPARKAFRMFPSIEEAFVFHGRTLATDPRYAAARAALPDLRAYVVRLSAVYATGPGYADLLWRIIEGSRLRQYDG